MKRFCLREFVIFGLRQAESCMFGGAMLVGIMASKAVWQPEWQMARYDFLFFYALSIQALFIAFRLETWEEAKVIAVFHVVGTIMELFKTHMGSWIYPEPNLIRIAGVPLFSGFMYSAVGSYMARVWRIFGFRFENYPPKTATIWLSAAIYINFFTHHYVTDLRYVLFAASAWLFGRVAVLFRPAKTYYRMNLLLGFFLVAFFIWLAENIGTSSAAWIYPSQVAAWHIVPLSKLGSWLLLMIISFVLVSLLHRED